MPYVLFRNEGVVVALDEEGPQLIITQYNAEDETDDIIALVPLPPTGIEVLDWSVGKRPQSETAAPEVANWARRSSSSRGADVSQHPAYRQPA